MSNLIPRIISELESRGISEVSAVINNQNIVAQKVLLKAGFAYRSKFDINQGFYQYQQQPSLPVNWRQVG
ncbi:hypothetical protein [Mucilaginibacter kameinonensis]|uniref:hypothetical protein n=1 Tax=Mucilaginibacter kameinonensis TaxID=452286 RepID=UPI000EF777DD|nr:hypothetical protein [Mucilaginibacter kameinonensis]